MLSVVLPYVREMSLAASHLAEFPRQIIGETLFLLLVVDGQRLLLLLQRLDLLQQGVADELLLLFCTSLLQTHVSSEIAVYSTGILEEFYVRFTLENCTDL